VVSLQLEVEASSPDLLVVDWDLLAPEAAETLVALYRVCPRLCVVVLGLRPESRDAALAAGADAFVSKVDAPDLVRRTLQASLAEVFARQPDQS
jgi:DNA-binding NarL/FixJ family response regulator